jgi:hypothetical protein
VGRTITLIVLREVEPCPRNALWEIFSFEAAKVAAGAGQGSVEFTRSPLSL